MSQSFSFHAKVADEALTKVSRLFNSSFLDIINELLQNARRAGATIVTIDQIDDPEFGSAIRVADNGPGLADPSTLFTLGLSDWNSELINEEDAAGMGFFSLANRGARCIVQKMGNNQSSILHASSDAFIGKEPILGSEGPDGHQGVTIIFPELPQDRVASIAKQSAQFCPITVVINGETAEQSDFLGDAEQIVEWHGIRMGFYRNEYASHSDENINFHGVTLRAKLPRLTQNFHNGYYARIDVVHCADLKLVLPARKEIVYDAFFEAMSRWILNYYYELILKNGTHSLSYDSYKKGCDLGIELPEAVTWLKPFSPCCADSINDVELQVERVSEDAIIYRDAEGAIEEQNVANAIAHQPDKFKIYQPNRNFEGYNWYDKLRLVTLAGYQITNNGIKSKINPEDVTTLTDRPDQIHILMNSSFEQTVQTLSLETDVILTGIESGDLDEVLIRITETSKIIKTDLTDLLVSAIFCPADTSDAGTYDQQLEWFQDAAEDRSFVTLQSREEADLNALERTIERELLWRIPKNSMVTITIDGRKISITGLNSSVSSAPD